MKTPQETRSGERRIFGTGFDRPLYPSMIVGEIRGPVICAWCEELMEEGIGPVSHGMCPTCHADFMAMLPED
jgi:hypothetical protein